MKIELEKLFMAVGVFASGTLNAFAQEQATSVGDLNLTLDKAIEIALAENPTIRVADKDVELKKVADSEAWQALLPTLDADLSLSHSIKVAEMKIGDNKVKFGQDGTTTATGALALNLPLFAPAVYQNMKLTKDDILLAQEKARSSRLDLVNQVTKAYYSALLAQDSYGVMQKSYNTSKENFDVVNNKFKVGTVSEYDKISAEVQMRNMNSSLVSAKTGLNLALLQLKVLMGVTADVNISIDDSLGRYESTLVLPQLPAEDMSLSSNSPLRPLDFNMKLLERSRKLLKTNFMPTAALQLKGQYQSISNPDWNLFKYSYSPSATLAFAVSVPIFHADNFTKLKSNKLQMAQLADTRIDTQRKLNMALESYKQNMASTIAQVESNAEAVKQADKAVEISGKRYEVGRGTILELNQSETARTQAELTYVQSIYDYLTNKADLEYTLGRDNYIK